MKEFIKFAKLYIDREERKDRAILKALIGHDPVTVAWCAYFAKAVIERVLGHSIKVTGMARSFLGFGNAVDIKDAEEGDIVVFSRGSSKIFGHVGFFISQDAKNIQVLGGNQSDKVCIKNYAKNRLLGVRRCP